MTAKREVPSLAFLPALAQGVDVVVRARELVADEPQLLLEMGNRGGVAFGLLDLAAQGAGLLRRV